MNDINIPRKNLPYIILGFIVIFVGFLFLGSSLFTPKCSNDNNNCGTVPSNSIKNNNQVYLKSYDDKYLFISGGDVVLKSTKTEGTKFTILVSDDFIKDGSIIKLKTNEGGFTHCRGGNGSISLDSTYPTGGELKIKHTNPLFGDSNKNYISPTTTFYLESIPCINDVGKCNISWSRDTLGTIVGSFLTYIPNGQILPTGAIIDGNANSNTVTRFVLTKPFKGVSNFDSQFYSTTTTYCNTLNYSNNNQRWKFELA
jgi:hypothetical protein